MTHDPKKFQSIWQLRQQMKKAGWTVLSSGDAQIKMCVHNKPLDKCQEHECVVRDVMES